MKCIFFASNNIFIIQPMISYPIYGDDFEIN